jgi:hypothetical protein
MGQSSQPGFALFRKQTAKGTFAADMDTASVGMKLRGGGLGPNRELLVPDAEIGGGRDVVDAYLGAVAWAGDFEFYARMESLASMFQGALGEPDASDIQGAGAWRHRFIPSDAAALPFYSVQEKVGASLEVFNYTDVVVNTLHLEADANGYLMGTVGLIAVHQEAGITEDPSPAMDDTFMIVGTNITLTYNGVTLPAKSFSLDINNNYEDDDFRLGSFFLSQLAPKRREVTASVTIRPETSALWRQAVYGSGAAVVAGGIVTRQPLVIDCLTYEDIAGSTPAIPFRLNIELPQVLLTPHSFDPSGDDIIETDIEMRAVRPVLANPLGTFDVYNGKATVA